MLIRQVSCRANKQSKSIPLLNGFGTVRSVVGNMGQWSRYSIRWILELCEFCLTSDMIFPRRRVGEVEDMVGAIKKPS